MTYFSSESHIGLYFLIDAEFYERNELSATFALQI